jgi:ABC-type uncharacterized transport system permease subunit
LATTSVIAPQSAATDGLIEDSDSIFAKLVNALAVPVLATLLALFVGGVVMDAAAQNWTIALYAYEQLWNGAFGSWYDIQETLVSATPLMFAAFAVAFSFRGGLFNIGAEGQLYAGAIFSTVIGVTFDWPGWILLPACIAAAAVGGAIWALVPGLLKAYRGAHEVITTMMLNYIALYLMHFLLNINESTGQPGPLQSTAGIPTSNTVHAWFPKIVPASLVSNPDLSLGLVLALSAGVVFWFVLNRTTVGYNVRATGFNIKAARYAGINVNRTVLITLLISGAFAGLAGASSIFGIEPYQMSDSFDSFTIGFDAIAVALLGRNTATGAVLAAILFGALAQGGTLMQLNAQIDPHIITILQGLIIFFVGADALVRYLAGRVGQPPRALYGRYLGHLTSRNTPSGTPQSSTGEEAV